MSYLIAATALVGQELRRLPDAVIELHGNEIGAVGSREDVDIPQEAQVHDASDAAIVPGFIDAHVHIGFYAPKEVLVRGVTTVRDLGWPPELIFPLARRSSSPDFAGPEILAAGPMLTTDGGYPNRAGWAPDGTGLVVSSDADAAEAISDLAREKAAVVKVALNPEAGPVLDGETLRTIVKEAHVAGLKVTGHVWGLTELEKAVEAGMDELAHMLMSPEVVPESLIEKMVERGMAVVPTLAIRLRRERKIAVSNLRRFREAGGLVVYGTDLGNARVGPGIDPREVKLMTKAGMTPTEIVESATVRSALWLGLDDRGFIAPGKRADLIALDGIDSVTSLTRVKSVWRAGKLVH
jgi:imidazolonepropionase-like amidohydrolase